jgi:hypothetical protein
MNYRMERYKGNKSNVWALIYDQCLPELKYKLEGMEGYDDAKRTNNVAKLLVMIRGYCCQFDLLSNECMLEVIKEYGGAGSMTHLPNMLKKEIKSMGTDLAKAMSD